VKVVVLYHPDSDHSRAIEEFARNFGRQVERKLELVSLESREGSAMASLYDVTTYPSILALQDDGQLLRMWQGRVLPLINEVAYYAQDQ
jgi:hypothetical protein